MNNWIKMLFGNKDERQKLLDFLATLPGPSPWALRESSQTFSNYKWAEAGDGENQAGKALLLKREGQVLLILDFYNYFIGIKALRICERPPL